MRDLELVVRKYKEEDRQRVREICWNTASPGKSGDLFLDDKELLADLCCNYYTDHEKESVFVAEVCKKVVGYLFGCKDTKRYKEIVRMKIAPGVIGDILMSRYKIGRRTSKFFYKIVEDSLRYGLPKKPYGEYPAHLHINVEEKWRGRGIGKKLSKNPDSSYQDREKLVSGKVRKECYIVLSQVGLDKLKRYQERY